MPIRLAAAALLALALMSPAAYADDDANAMNFTAWHSNDGVLFGEGSRDYIFADGDITADTPAVLQKFLDTNHPASGTTVVLNSDGGDLGAGLAIGRLIRKYKLWTEVGSLLPINIGVSPTVPAKMVPYLRIPSAPPYAGYCYSSCTFAFLGGVSRFINYGSDYGVHRFKFVDPKNTDDISDQAQQMSGELVKYVVEMGVNAQFITQMSLKGPSDINHLKTQQLVDLKVVTPQWHTTWRILAATDGSGFYLAGWTDDEWGQHAIDITCAPPAQVVTVAGGNPPQPGYFLDFKIEPGERGAAETLIKAVDKYVLELDGGAIVVPKDALVKAAYVDTSYHTRIGSRIRVSRPFLAAVMQSSHIGFAYILNKTANVPLRLVQFEGGLNAKVLKRFAATCR